VKVNKHFALTKERWISYIVAPLAIILISIFIQNSIQNFRFKRDTQVQITRLASSIESLNYDISIKNLNALASLDLIKNTVTGNKPIDNIESISVLTAMRKATNAEMVYILNKKGNVVACTIDSVSGQSFTGKNFAFRPYFKNVVEKKTSFYYPAVGVVSNKRGLYLGVPIFGSVNTY